LLYQTTKVVNRIGDMMRVKEIKKIYKKEIIVPDYLIRPLEDIEDNDIKELSESIESIDMINEIDVRLLENGKYELMAGGRRFQALRGEEILAKIYEDVDTIDAMIIGLAENNNRKKIDINIRDDYIYKIWKKANESGKIKHKNEFAKKIGMKESTVNIIIQAGEEKEKYKNMGVMERATTNELYETRYLKDYQEVREQLLGHMQDGNLDRSRLEIMSKNFKRYLDKGYTIEKIKTMIENIARSELKNRQKVSTNDKHDDIESGDDKHDNKESGDYLEIHYTESSVLDAKETPKSETVLIDKIDANKNINSDFNMHQNYKLETSCTKEENMKVDTKNRALEKFKNNSSKHKSYRHDDSSRSSQQNIDRKKKSITKGAKYFDREMEIVKNLWIKAGNIRSDIILGYKDEQLTSDYDRYLKLIVDHLNKERAKILLSKAKFVSEK
jgi:hypothetical protein